MHYRQTVLVSMLATAVTLAGVACACAVPTADIDGATGSHHAHHADGHAVAAMDCDHADCGDCMADEAVSKNEALRDHVPQLPKLSFDDDAQTPAEFAANATALRGFNYHPPVPRLARAADTAVRRFDRLLN